MSAYFFISFLVHLFIHLFIHLFTCIFCLFHLFYFNLGARISCILFFALVTFVVSSLKLP